MVRELLIYPVMGYGGNNHVRRTWILKSGSGTIWTRLPFPKRTIVLTQQHGAEWIYSHRLTISIEPTPDAKTVRVNELHETTGFLQRIFSRETAELRRRTAELLTQLKKSA
jgi:hypothetical protein